MGSPDGEPMRAMGRFVQEAVAVNPASGIVYETEDNRPAGLYRFIPEREGKLEKRGKLHMLAISNQFGADLRAGVPVNERLPVTWVDIEDPEAKSTRVFTQVEEKGTALFTRLEWAWFGSGNLYFTSTDGGNECLTQGMSGGAEGSRTPDL